MPNTELKECPTCKRIYTDEDYCIDCNYSGPDDAVELESIGEYSPEEIKRIKNNMCDCEPFNSCPKCAKTDYQKAIEDIKHLIAQVSDSDGVIFDYTLAADNKILKEIYRITHRDFEQKTEWIDPLIARPNYGAEYWVLFKDSSVKKGRFWEPTKKWFWDIQYKKQIEQTVIKYAEIKPPVAP